jgi:hypothetical protein
MIIISSGGTIITLLDQIFFNLSFTAQQAVIPGGSSVPVLDENDCQQVMMDFDDLKVAQIYIIKLIPYTDDALYEYDAHNMSDFSVHRPLKFASKCSLTSPSIMTVDSSTTLPPTPFLSCHLTKFSLVSISLRLKDPP